MKYEEKRFPLTRAKISVTTVVWNSEDTILDRPGRSGRLAYSDERVNSSTITR